MFFAHLCLHSGFACGFGVVGRGGDEAANADCGEDKNEISFHRFCFDRSDGEPWPGPRVRRDRTRASPPRAVAISPSTKAAAPPTTPLPVPEPPFGDGQIRPALTTAMGPATRATMAPILPLPVPIRPADRRRASP